MELCKCALNDDAYHGIRSLKVVISDIHEISKYCYINGVIKQAVINAHSER